MRVQYTPSNGSGETYDIESDRHGSYAVMLRGKVIKRVTALPHYMGRPRWGSRQLEIEAVEDAKKAIDAIKPERGVAPVRVED